MTETISYYKKGYPMKEKFVVELVKGHVRYFYQVKAKNGEILLTSQKYFSRSNAQRAAHKTADRIEATYKEL